MRPYFIWVSCFGLLLPSCQQRSTENRDVEMIKQAPSIDGEKYQCGEMIQVVNHLRQLGKDKSLAVLREYLRSDGAEDDKILIICRLLFVNPKGWEPPILGAPVPATNDKAVKEFPLFPIALSNRVPFLLVLGYELAGIGESGRPCLKLCEGMSLVIEDYPLDGYEKAALALTKMEAFRQLYDEKEVAHMADIILGQAKEAKSRK
jgi:hypothetical protein